MEILDIKGLSFTYAGSDKKAIENLSFSLEKGDFLVVCGSTGSGKSTLMRLIKRELMPNGTLEGKIYIDGDDVSALSEAETAFKVGCVMQNPEHQIVTDKVWHELAFGLENMGVPQDAMRRRVAETACFFGIENLFDKSVSELSGGQKQLVCLASVMAMQPDILILDEPTAQLDPISASEFISTVYRLSRELSLTVIMIEHRLEEVIPISDKLLALDDGRQVAFGSTRDTVRKLGEYPGLKEGMPAALRLFWKFGGTSVPPLTNTEGRRYIEENFGNGTRALPNEECNCSDESALELDNVYFRYAREAGDVLRGVTLKVNKGEIFCILGGNGSGKSTMLWCAAGVNKPYSGSIKIFGKKIKDYKNGDLYRNCVSLLPQEVQTVFLKDTVGEEIRELGQGDIPFDLSHLAKKHPYDLSGGEQQLVALAKVLMTKPRLLLLDEPTKGIDAHTRGIFASLIKKLSADGVTVVIVTHDVEFAANIADRCAMFFRGEVTSCGTPREFFSENSFYTTAVSRMTRGYYDRAVTLDDAEKLCRINAENL